MGNPLEANYAAKAYLSIKEWAEEDQPRGKLLQKGRQSLTDAELLAIILRSGSANETALDLAKQILHQCQNDLRVLGKSSVADLRKFKGVGEAKALSIVAAMELARRRQQISPKEQPIITSSDDAYRIMAPLLTDKTEEEFWILLLNAGNRLIRYRRISIGGVNKTLADARVIFRYALEERASAIILCHNHPSGALRPSGADIQLTEKLFSAGGLIDVLVLDHLIIADGGYYSFADDGKVF